MTFVPNQKLVHAEVVDISASAIGFKAPLEFLPIVGDKVELQVKDSYGKEYLFQGHLARVQKRGDMFFCGAQCIPEQAANSLIVTSRYWQLIREAADANNAGNYSLGLDKANAAIKVDGEGAEGLAQLGRAYAGKKQYSQAEKYFGDALQLESNNDTALQGMITLCIQTGRRAEASALINAAARLSGADPNRFNYLRLQLMNAEVDEFIAKGDADKAIGVLKRAIVLDSNTPWLRLKLADVYKDAGHPDAGVLVMREGVKALPKDPEMIKASVIYLSSINQEQQADDVISGYIRTTPKPSAAIQIAYAELLNRLTLDSELSPLLNSLGKKTLAGENRTEFLKIKLAYEVRKATESGCNESQLTE
ncbi:PilZ domain-containing protein [Polynucleobacter necessarius]|uniref:PilZ domain-containing protein n=1 Tax=Polynucleobacter necessarius TaxID=576610 RepID=UPI0013B050A7|nr:PilZ domain-containing protein [Polynucleobacter necessarius]